MSRSPTEPFKRRSVFYVLLLLVVFMALLACGLGGLYLFYRNRDFYQAFRTRLSPRFYISAVALLLGSSLLYAPFSYGISNYFLLAHRSEARFSALFFLFGKPVLLLKAILVTIGKKIRIYLERLMILLAAAILEVVLFFLFLLFTGEDLFSVPGNPFQQAAEFMMNSPVLIVCSVLLWCVVLFFMVLNALRYVLCKYLLIAVQDASVIQVLKVGRSAIRGALLKTLFFYLQYIALLLWAFFSNRAPRREPFSVYAERLALAGWRDYCRRRSLR